MSNVLPPLGSSLPFPNSNDVAILKYVGSVSGHDGVFCGLELCGSLASRGKNDGNVGSVQYFQVDVPGSGLFVPLRKVISWLGSGAMVNQNELPNDKYTIPSNTVSAEASPSFTTSDTNELRRHINVLEKRLVQRENDLRELDIQLDELDATLRANDSRLSRKEERFNRYRLDKEEEIKLLVTTIETLEKKALESEEAYTAKVKELENILAVRTSYDNNSELLREKESRIESLEKELKVQKDMYQTFKISKTKEIDELRKFEMDNYKLHVELEKLQVANVDSKNMETLQIENEELVKNIEDLRLDLRMQDDKIGNLEELIKNTNADNRIKDIKTLELRIEALVKELQDKNDIIRMYEKKGSLVDENGGLKVYQPEFEIDPAAGRDNYCSFCDREGHETQDCPYEKDNLEMF